MTDFSKMSDEGLRIAVAVALGWTRFEMDTFEVPCAVPPTASGLHHAIPNWSTSIADAWELVEEMNKTTGVNMLVGDDSCWISFSDPKLRLGIPNIYAPTAPRAICLAFLATRTK